MVLALIGIKLEGFDHLQHFPAGAFPQGRRGRAGRPRALSLPVRRCSRSRQPVADGSGQPTPRSGSGALLRKIPLNDGDAVAGFVQRYGDPWGQLDARKPVHTARWGDLASALAVVADAWAVTLDDQTALGRSEDPESYQRAVQAFRDDLWPQIRGDLRVELGSLIGGAVVVPVVGTLAAFMGAVGSKRASAQRPDAPLRALQPLAGNGPARPAGPPQLPKF